MHLAGCDLSAGMLTRARARGVYDELQQVELLAFLNARPASFDLLVCTDTLIYLGDLRTTALGLAAALQRHGWFACSIEALADADPQPLRLMPHGRHAHRIDHAVGALTEAGLRIVEHQPCTLRVEAGVGVPGWMLLARVPGPG